MTFFIDAHLTPRLVKFLNDLGHGAMHAKSLAEANATPDSTITILAELNGFVVVTKDYDFRESQITRGVPSKLLLVVVGNLSRRETLTLFQLHIAEIIELFETCSCVELGHSGVNVCG
jgi:predicted nuclease of predicted toxin-antitoxin system